MQIVACHTCAIHSLVSGYCRRTWKGQLPVIVPHVPRKGFYLATRFFSSCCFCSFSSCIILFVAAPSSFPFLRLCAFELSVSSQTLLKACRTQTTRTLNKKMWQTWVWVCFKCLFVHLGTTCFFRPFNLASILFLRLSRAILAQRFGIQSGAILFRDFLVYRQQCAQMCTPRTPIFIRSRNFKKIL